MVLEDDGLVIVTGPNPSHPSRQWSNVTHVLHWPLGDLSGLMREAGYEVIGIARYNKHRFPRNPVKRLIANVVCEIFRVDWRDSLMLTARNATHLA